MNSNINFSFEYGVSDQITPLVKRLIANNPGPFTYTGTGTFIIGTKELAVIDPGPIDNNHLKAILKVSENNKISHIIVTHTHIDHSPLSKPLQEITGAPIYSYFNHKMDTKTNNDFEEGYDNSFKPDVIVNDGDLIKGFDWTLEAIHTPGHTSNHVCYSLKEEKILFSGDHVMGWSTTVIVPPDGDMDEYLKSLKKLLKRDDEIYLPTHGTQINDPQKLVKHYISHRINRENQILEAIKLGNSMINEMVKVIYVDVDPGLHPAASMSTLAHLNRMVKNNIVEIEGKGLKAIYKLI